METLGFVVCFEGEFECVNRRKERWSLRIRDVEVAAGGIRRKKMNITLSGAVKHVGQQCCVGWML